MNLKKFKILRFLKEYDGYITQRIISEVTKISLGSVNQILLDMEKQKIIHNDYSLTSKGIATIEKYRVKNAIILAAGMSTRFFPISYELPKSLIVVKGEVIIERLIRQLKEAGINEIIVVIGYMSEKFFYLEEKYGVKLVVNPEYRIKNTHSSIFVSKKYLKNTYICCADNYYPHNPFHQYEYRAFYCSVYLPGISYVERAFKCDKTGLIVDTNKPSNNQWIMYGHAYFDNSFSKEFKTILEDYYNREGVENMYWENIYAENVKRLPMYIKKCEQNDIYEFDSIEELKVFDKDFIKNNPVSIFRNICKTLKCDIKDIKDIESIKGGLNNKSFSFMCNGCKYIYRHPGLNASFIINREKEKKSLIIAKELELDTSYINMSVEDGWKISRYYEVKENFDFSNKKHIAMLSKQLKKLHLSKRRVGYDFNYEKEIDRVLQIIKKRDPSIYYFESREREFINKAFALLNKDSWQKTLCHNDLYEPNLLVTEKGLIIIDWEFAGDADIGFDICKLFSRQEPKVAELDEYLKYYFGRKTTKNEKLHLLCCATIIYYYWYIWGIYANQNDGKTVDWIVDWKEKYLKYKKELEDFNI